MRYTFRAFLAALSESPPDDREEARSQALADAVFTLEAVRTWAEHHRDMDPPPCRGSGRRAAATCMLSLTC